MIDGYEEAAFPHGPMGDSMTFEDGRTKHQFGAQPGMSLRDWFAGQALIGMVYRAQGEDERNFRYVTSRAYSIADAMMEARKEATK